MNHTGRCRNASDELLDHLDVLQTQYTRLGIAVDAEEATGEALSARLDELTKLENDQIETIRHLYQMKAVAETTVSEYLDENVSHDQMQQPQRTREMEDTLQGELLLEFTSQCNAVKDLCGAIEAIARNAMQLIDFRKDERELQAQLDDAKLRLSLAEDTVRAATTLAQRKEARRQELHAHIAKLEQGLIEGKDKLRQLTQELKTEIAIWKSEAAFEESYRKQTKSEYATIENQIKVVREKINSILTRQAGATTSTTAATHGKRR